MDILDKLKNAMEGKTSFGINPVLVDAISEIERLRKQIPDGYKVAPLEPTEAMRVAWNNGARPNWPSIEFSDRYKAMIAASPLIEGK